MHDGITVGMPSYKVLFSGKSTIIEFHLKFTPSRVRSHGRCWHSLKVGFSDLLFNSSHFLRGWLIHLWVWGDERLGWIFTLGITSGSQVLRVPRIIGSICASGKLVWRTALIPTLAWIHSLPQQAPSHRGCWFFLPLHLMPYFSCLWTAGTATASSLGLYQ